METDQDTTYQQNTDISYKQVADTLRLVILPVLIILGITGHTFTIIVLRSKTLKSFKTSRLLLTLLSGVNILMLGFSFFLQWLPALRHGSALSSYHSELGCQLYNFQAFFLCHVTVWTVVLVTIERVITVYLPFEYERLCSVKRIASGWGLLLITLAAIDSQAFWTTGITNARLVNSEMITNGTNFTEANTTRCGWKFSEIGALETFRTIDYTLIFVPFGVILLGNVIIIVTIYRSTQSVAHGLRQEGRTSKMAPTTLMLLSLAFTYLILTTPIHVFTMSQFPVSSLLDLSENIGQMYLIGTCLYLLYILNYSLNFALYCFSGSNFRVAAKEIIMVRCFSKDLPQDSTRLDVSSNRQISG